MKKVSLIIIAICLYIVGNFHINAHAAPDNEFKPRSFVSVFKYSRVHSDQEEKEFKEFIEIISAKILNLAEEFKIKGDNFNYFGQLKTSIVLDEKTGKPKIFEGNMQELDEHWKKSGALGVLNGRLRLQDKIITVRSNVFLGELKGELASPIITLDMPITDDEFDSTRDSHSLVTLYAMAMDAKKRGRPPYEILSILSEANAIAKDFKKDMPGIQTLQSAINKSLDEEKLLCKGSQ
jgi:hypothetical protein